VRTFGIDIQSSRASLVLHEDGDARLLPVGDGFRALVPVAARDGLWATPAVERTLADSTQPLQQGTDLLSWTCEPLDPDFLRGIRDRLERYVGASGRAPGATPDQTVFVADDTRDRAGLVPEMLERVGFEHTHVISGPDALAARWMAEPIGASMATDPNGPETVVAAACGEARTSIASYRLHRAGASVAVEPQRAEQIDLGALPWTEHVAQLVLQRCADDVVHAGLSLPILDSVLELAWSLRHAGEGASVWSGVLADRLFAPLSFTRADCRTWPGAEALTERLEEVLGSVVHDAAPGNVLVLVGGIGAVWPTIGDAVGESQTWSSDEPQHDLATGAAVWPTIRRRFTSSSEPPVQASDDPPSGSQVPAATSGSAARRAGPSIEVDVPPWERDR
jgi:hypothetical protein